MVIMVSAYAGWDSFTPLAGECKNMKCKVCGEEMTMHPNCQGPRNSISAMAVNLGESKVSDYPLFDHFICPNVDTGWHLQARILLQRAEESPSSILADVYKTEANDIMASKNPTLEKFDKFAKSGIEKGK